MEVVMEEDDVNDKLAFINDISHKPFEVTPTNKICRRAPRAAHKQDRITNEIVQFSKLNYLVRDPILFVGCPWRLN